MELGLNNSNGNPFTHANELRQTVAPVQAIHTQPKPAHPAPPSYNTAQQSPSTNPQKTNNSHRVLDAYKVERVNHSEDARELRPITIEDTSFNKVRPFLVVAQNGHTNHSVDLYV